MGKSLSTAQAISLLIAIALLFISIPGINGTYVASVIIFINAIILLFD